MVVSRNLHFSLPSFFFPQSLLFSAQIAFFTSPPGAPERGTAPAASPHPAAGGCCPQALPVEQRMRELLSCLSASQHGWSQRTELSHLTLHWSRSGALPCQLRAEILSSDRNQASTRQRESYLVRKQPAGSSRLLVPVPDQRCLACLSAPVTDFAAVRKFRAHKRQQRQLRGTIPPGGSTPHLAPRGSKDHHFDSPHPPSLPISPFLERR